MQLEATNARLKQQLAEQVLQTEVIHDALKKMSSAPAGEKRD
jgi:hypothetical protein